MPQNSGDSELANRLSKITTRTGDDGSTGLGDGSRTGKESMRIEVLGEVDELNSHIGLLLSEPLPPMVTEALLHIQHDLFDLGGELCIPGSKLMDEPRLTNLEQLTQGFNGELPPLKEFILPGGCRAASLAHVARTVCRRAERRLVALKRQETVSDDALRYLNRLSDLLFVLARWLNRHAGQPNILWQR